MSSTRHNLESACIRAAGNVDNADDFCVRNYGTVLAYVTVEQLRHCAATVRPPARERAKLRPLVLANEITNAWEGNAEK